MNSSNLYKITLINSREEIEKIGTLFFLLIPNIGMKK